MLKTTGYRKRDLSLLFGGKAALLGLVGGIAGALLAIGISLLLLLAVQHLFGFTIAFLLDPGPSLVAS